MKSQTQKSKKMLHEMHRGDTVLKSAFKGSNLYMKRAIMNPNE